MSSRHIPSHQLSSLLDGTLSPAQLAELQREFGEQTIANIMRGEQLLRNNTADALRVPAADPTAISTIMAAVRVAPSPAGPLLKIVKLVPLIGTIVFVVACMSVVALVSAAELIPPASQLPQVASGTMAWIIAAVVALGLGVWRMERA